MAMRHKMNKRANARSYVQGRKTPKKNYNLPPQRGGWRL